MSGRAAALLFLVAAAPRLFLAAAQDLTRQDAWSVGRVTAERASVAEVVRTARDLDVHPPLFYVLLHGAERIVGLDRFRLKGLHALAGAASVWLIARWARAVAGGGAAFWAAALAAASGYHLFLSVMLRMYVLQAFWIGWAGLCGWRYWHDEPRRRDLVGFSLALWGALHTHYYALFAWVAFLLAPGSRSFRDPARARWWWLAQGGVLLASLPWYGWGFLHHLSEGRTATVEAGMSAALWGGVLFPVQAFVMGVRHATPALAVISAVGVAAALATACRKRGSTGFLIALAAVPILCALAYSLFRRPIFQANYAVVAFPPLCVLAGIGLARWPRPLAVAFGVVYLAAGAISVRTIAGMGNPGYRIAAERLLQEGNLEDLVVVNAMAHSGDGFLFHAGGLGVSRDRLRLRVLMEDPTHAEVEPLTLWRAWLKDPDVAARSAVERFEELLAEHPRVWFLNFGYGWGAYGALDAPLRERLGARIADYGPTRVYFMERE